MVKSQIVDSVRDALSRTENIRNLSVIAHVDHGKSTLTDSLIFKAGLIAKDAAGRYRFMDTRPDEQDRTITIKSTSVSMVFDVVPPKVKVLPRKGEWKPGQAKASVKSDKTEPFLLNLIDSPGHVDFSSEVTAALRVTDGALVVVDCIEGVRVQTETVLRQALTERVKPVLFLNKLDRIFKMDPEEAYQTLARAVESINVVIARNTSAANPLGDVSVYPQAGTVGFGSGLYGWGFTLEHFAALHHDRFGMCKRKLMKKLWGAHFYDARTKKWHTKAVVKGKRLPRGFCLVVLRPLFRLARALASEDQGKAIYSKFSANHALRLDKEVVEEGGKTLYRAIMKEWLPAADALLHLIVHHLPSPKTAQLYRADALYDGPADDEACSAIRACDPDGPLMVYVSKMVPIGGGSRFIAFGRVFSGTVCTGQQVRIQGPDFVPGSKRDLRVCNLQGTCLMMGPHHENLSSFPAGTTVGLVGVDQHLLKSGTITTIKGAHNFKHMRYSVAPIVRVAVHAVNAAQQGKLCDGLRRLAKSDPLVLTFLSPAKEHVVAGCGELHLQVCLKDLREEFLKDVPLVVSDPVVMLSETISQASDTCMAKSRNKHNRVFLTAEPLSQEVCQALQDDVLDLSDKHKFVRDLVDTFGWGASSAKKVWAIGCTEDTKTCVLVDETLGVQRLHDIKDSIVSAFLQTLHEGVLCGEPVRGVRFNLVDAKVHQDAMHRGAPQVCPAVRRAMHACLLSAAPRILEPLYLATVVVNSDSTSGVYSTLRKRRGRVVCDDDESVEDAMQGLNGQQTIRALLPVTESFGFTEDLRKATAGKAFPQLSFARWSELPGDPVADESSLAYSATRAARARKSMKPQLPHLSDLHDRI